MRVFVTGANGWIGSCVVRDLIAHGHTVEGLVRSGEAARSVEKNGARPLVGSLDELGLLSEAASRSDAVIHTAFGLDLSRIEALAREDRVAIEAFGDAFAGSTRPIVVTGGFLQTDGRIAHEHHRHPVMPAFPRASEQTAFALAEQGIHASVVRNPRSVHGKGEKHGFVPMLAALARKTGVSAYVGEGQNLWPSVHRLDAARVYRLALERGARGEAYHAVAEEGVPFRLIAEAIGRQVDVPARSLPAEEAEAHFGPVAVWVANHGPASSAHTRAVLSWAPREVGIVEDIEQADYSA